MVFHISKFSRKICTSFSQTALFFLLLFASSSAMADELTAVKIDASQAVIYCDVKPTVDVKRLITALNDGSPITFTWDITISEVRDYWLNKDIGNIQFYRLAMPDLVSHQWRLKDSNSGINRNAPSKQRAIAFLAQLKHFPIIDKSLLEPQKTYKINVRLHIEEGTTSDDWLNNILRFGKTVAIGTFTLP